MLEDASAWTVTSPHDMTAQPPVVVHPKYQMAFAALLPVHNRVRHGVAEAGV